MVEAFCAKEKCPAALEWRAGGFERGSCVEKAQSRGRGSSKKTKSCSGNRSVTANACHASRLGRGGLNYTAIRRSNRLAPPSTQYLLNLEDSATSRYSTPWPPWLWEDNDCQCIRGRARCLLYCIIGPLHSFWHVWRIGKGT